MRACFAPTALLALAACGGPSLVAPGPRTFAQCTVDVPPVLTSPPAVVAECADTPEVLAWEDRARTPRDDSLAERLALSAGTVLTADESVYQRVACELPRLAAVHPDVTLPGLTVPSFESERIDVVFADGYSEPGALAPFRCLNRALDGDTTDGFAGNTRGVAWDGRYHVERITELYGALDVIATVHQGGGVLGWGAIASIGLVIDGDTFRYAATRARCSGDCTVDAVLLFESEPDGTITFVDELRDEASIRDAMATFRL